MCETTDAFGMRDLLISRNIHHTWRISIKHFDFAGWGKILSKSILDKITKITPLYPEDKIR